MRSVAFLGAKRLGYHCLYHLIENADRLGIRLAGVLSSKNDRFPEIDLLALAKEHIIPVFSELDELFANGPVDFLISVQFNSILQQRHIDQARSLAVNLHMAPLPEYRGCNQFSLAILEEKKEFGTTLHRLEASIDAGAIIAEKRFPIAAGITVDELFNQTESASIALFKEAIPSVFDQTCSFTDQSSLVSERGTSLHYRNEINELKIIDPTWSNEKKALHVRATSMPGFEPPYAMKAGKKHFYRLNHKAEVEEYAIGNAPRLRNTGIRSVEFGENVLVYEPANMYECFIDRDAVIGPYTEIQRGVKIGAGTKVQSHAFICELVEIGQKCFVSHGVMFINDKFSKGGPAGGDRSQWKNTVVGNRVSIGSNATILPVHICDDVVIGAGAVVTKNITEPGIYAGNPAKKIK